MKFLIHYFSGTGNTARAVKTVKSELEKAGNTVVVYRVSAGIPNELSADHHIFAFPTLAHSPPVFFTDYLRHLPANRGTPASVLCTYAGGFGHAVDLAASFLRNRGFQISQKAGCFYPYNWTQFYNPDPQEKNAEDLKTGDGQARQFALDILSQKKNFRIKGEEGKIFSPILTFFFGIIGRRFLGKTYIADHNCNNCELCIDSCPVHAITLTRLKKHYWLFNCEDCNRCINICPKKAIQTSGARFTLHIGLNVLSIIGLIIATLSVANPVIEAIGKPLGIISLVAANILCAILWIIFQFTILDRLLFAIQEIPGIKPFFERSWTRGFRRYKAPGFNPARD
jgi:ferredoxin